MPVKLKIKKITRNGLVKIEFNQPLIVPEMVKSLSKGRRLSLSSIDINSIISFIFVSNDGSDAKQVKYYLKLIEWQDEKLDVQMTLLNPLDVS